MLCNVDISDIVHLTTTHGGGGGFDDDFYVEGIHYQARPGGTIPYVELTLDVSPKGSYDANPFGTDPETVTPDAAETTHDPRPRPPPHRRRPHPRPPRPQQRRRPRDICSDSATPSGYGNSTSRSGSTAFDSSGNGNDMTVPSTYAAPTWAQTPAGPPGDQPPCSSGTHPRPKARG